MLEKQYYILQKYHSEVGTDGRVIEQTGKDKYITIVNKGYFFRGAKIAARR